MNYDFGTAAIALRLIAQEKAANASYMENMLLEFETGVATDCGEGLTLHGMRAVVAQTRRDAVIFGQVSELLIDLSPREGEVRGAALSMRLPLTARAATPAERVATTNLRDEMMTFLRSQIARFDKLTRWPRSPLRPWRAR